MKNKLSQTLIILGIFLLTSVWFHWFDWASVIKNENKAVLGTDLSMAEFNIESVYQQIKQHKNLFIFEGRQVYPYTINIALNDPGVSNLVWYYPLRAWFSPSQAVGLIMIINTFLASCLMYLFLRKVRVKNELAILLALIFAYASTAPFRNLGHYTYTAVYIFPLGAWMLLKWGEAKNRVETIIWAGLGGLYGAFVLMLNFYYFIGIAIATGLTSIYYVFKNKPTLDWWKKVSVTLLASTVIMITLLTPWIKSVGQFIKIDSQVPAAGFAGATELSGDLLGVLIPTNNHWWYQELIKLLPPDTRYFRFWQNLVDQNSNHSIYAGVFVILGIALLIVKRKKLAQPYGWGATVFGLLLLGPFLKIASRIAIDLEGISVVFPLPFLLLHYLPGMASLRAPTRFFPLAMFFLVVVIGIGVTEWMKQLSSDKWKKWGVVLGCVILVEIYTIPLSSNTLTIPDDLYYTIGNDPLPGTILEIPFVVRDGFEYLGEKDAVSFQNGSLIYDKPVLGGYFARLHPDIFSYYQEQYFVGNVLRLLDEKRNNLTDLDVQRVSRELDFLNVRYIMLRQNESYTPIIQAILTKLPTKLISSVQDFSLYQINIKQDSYDVVKLGQPDDYLYIAQGLGPREDGYRAIVQKKAKLFWKTSTQTKSLSLTSSSEIKRRVKVYLGNILLGEIEVGPEKNTYKWEVGSIPTEIQILTLVVENVRRGESMNSRNGVKIYEYGTL